MIGDAAPSPNFATKDVVSAWNLEENTKART